MENKMAAAVFTNITHGYVKLNREYDEIIRVFPKATTILSIALKMLCFFPVLNGIEKAIFLSASLFFDTAIFRNIHRVTAAWELYFNDIE